MRRHSFALHRFASRSDIGPIGIVKPLAWLLDSLGQFSRFLCSEMRNGMRCCVVWKLNLLQVHRHYICSRSLHSFHHGALHYRHDTRRIGFLCAACCRLVWRTDQVPVVDAAQTTFPICASSKRPNARVLRHRQHIFGIGRFRYSER